LTGDRLHALDEVGLHCRVAELLRRRKGELGAPRSPHRIVSPVPDGETERTALLAEDRIDE
jgi:hypothetical protein